VYPEEEVPAGGIITGLGVIEGVTCIVVANDSTYVYSSNFTYLLTANSG